MVDDRLWDRFVETSPHGTVFSSAEWIAAAAKAQGGRPVMLGAWDGDELIAGVGVTEVSRGPLRQANTPVMAPYGGFMYTRESGENGDTDSRTLRSAETLIDHLQRNCHHVLLSHAPAFGDIRPFSWRNWDQRVRYTYLLDITDTDRLWRGFRDRAKRQIKKAADTVTIGGDIVPETLGAEYTRLFRERNVEPPLPPRILIDMVRRLAPTGMLDIIATRDRDGELAALQVLVKGYDTVYTLVYGTVPEQRHTGADALMIWEAARRYSGTHARLDLVGANIPSIAFYKSGFGGTLTPHYVTERFRSNTVRCLFTAYTHIRNRFS